MRTTALLCAALVTVAVVGCKRSQIGQQADEQAKMVEAQTAASQKLDQIGSQLSSISGVVTAREIEPDFVEDLAVATRLTGLLAVQAGKQQAEEAAATTDRLVRCLAALLAGAPAARIQEHLERAESQLSAGELAAASGQVLAAAGAAYNPTAPALVPDVLSQLEQASAALSNADSAKATEAIGEVMAVTSQDATVSDLVNAQMTALDARESLRRKSWPVLVAQTQQILDLLRAVQKRASPQEKPKAAAPVAAPASSATPPEGETSGAAAKAPQTASPATAPSTTQAASPPAAPASSPAPAPKAAPAQKTP